MQASSLFDNLSTTYNSVNGLLTFGLDDVARKKAVQMFPNHNDEAVVLDLFGGAGNNIPFLLATFKNAQVDTMDSSVGMINEGKSRYSNSDVRFIQADFIEYDFQLKKYDAIICTYGLKCIPQESYTFVFSKLEKLLKPKGQIIFLDVFQSKQNWVNQIFKIYLKFVLSIHPKVNNDLKKQYLNLTEYMNNFNQEVFEKSISETTALSMEELAIRIPMLRAYRITKR